MERTARPITLDSLREENRASGLHLEWLDCPTAVDLHYFNCTIVLLNMAYHPGPQSIHESNAGLLIARRDCVKKISELLEQLHRRDWGPHLNTLHGKSRPIAPATWADLVADAKITFLLRRDFEGFWEREDWSREHRLPFQRGYLLHGPPGNGKTTAIRAMSTTQKLNAYTVRLFDPQTEDGDLDELFDRAHHDRPSMVLLEDFDRAFPRSGESGSRISIEQLLNCLDGVVNGKALWVATANEPAVLDSAILRRPGRFDRVVHFPNPGADLRREYFRRLNRSIEVESLGQPTEQSEGFSFAQLREASIIARQRA